MVFVGTRAVEAVCLIAFVCGLHCPCVIPTPNCGDFPASMSNLNKEARRLVDTINKEARRLWPQLRSSPYLASVLGGQPASADTSSNGGKEVPAAGLAVPPAVMARIQRYSTMLNELTGYKHVEALKKAVVEADERLTALRQELQVGGCDPVHLIATRMMICPTQTHKPACIF